MLFSVGLYSDFFFFFSFTAMIKAHNWRRGLIREGAYSPLWCCPGDWVEMFAKCIVGWFGGRVFCCSRRRYIM